VKRKSVKLCFDCLVVTPECEHLIRHLLVVNPARRYGFREIVSHKWLAAAGADDAEFIRLMDESQDVARDVIDRPLEVGVLQHMKHLGMDVDQVTCVSRRTLQVLRIGGRATDEHLHLGFFESLFEAVV
jgi:hypothetical protein